MSADNPLIKGLAEFLSSLFSMPPDRALEELRKTRSAVSSEDLLLGLPVSNWDVLDALSPLRLLVNKIAGLYAVLHPEAIEVAVDRALETMKETCQRRWDCEMASKLRDSIRAILERADASKCFRRSADKALLGMLILYIYEFPEEVSEILQSASTEDEKDLGLLYAEESLVKMLEDLYSLLEECLR